MTADVIAHPLARIVAFPRLTIDERVTEIENLTRTEGNTRHGTTAILRSVCTESLTDDDLWAAWLAAENAILIRDVTKIGDHDYLMWAQRAEHAVMTLLYGPISRSAA
jgi:hypothetical protein